MSYCGNCGAKLRPLFTGLFCPNDCDRPKKPKGAFTQPTAPAEPGPILWGCDESDAELDPLDWSDVLDAAGFGLGGGAGNGRGGTCPNCGSTDTEPFPGCAVGDYHCNPCGDVWYY